jgi:NADH:ubiquinone oxidoreductase subunit C
MEAASTAQKTALQQAKAILGPWIESATYPEDNRLDLIIPGEQLTPLVESVHGSGWGYLSAITGLDHGAKDGGLEALYHFCNGPAVLTLRVPLPSQHASVPTIAGVIPAATIHERELMEMFGITVRDIPDPKHLLLPDGWPEGKYPLRKSFDVSSTPVDLEPKPITETDGDNGTFVIPIGPSTQRLRSPATSNSQSTAKP